MTIAGGAQRAYDLGSGAGSHDPSTRSEDVYADVQAAIDTFDEHRQRIMLLRLAKHLNNGDQHFDHGPIGYSWLCLRCAAQGKRGLNGWVGALHTLHAAANRETS